MNIKDQLIRCVVRHGSSEERRWEFKHANGRSFDIRQFGRTKFLLGEFKPNGRICKETPKGPIFSTSEIVIQGLKSCPPNELVCWIAERGIAEPMLVKVGVGIGLDSLYWPSLEAACDQIREAIENNNWYRKTAPLTEAELAASKATALVPSVAFWQSALKAAVAAEAEPGIFKGCHCSAGKLTKDAKNSIIRYLNKPNQKLWNEIRSTMITGEATLGSAWRKVDAKSPRSGSRGYPSREMLEQAIRHAVSAWKEHAKNKLQEALKAKGSKEVAHAMS